VANAQAWVEGVRLRTLPASIAAIPVGLGAAAQVGAIHWDRAALALAVAVLLQVGANLVNDYSDGVRGTDSQRTGPQRLVASGAARPRTVLLAAAAAFLLAGAAGIALVWLAHQWWWLAIGAAAIVAAVTYTGGPRPYGYVGLGEVGVFAFFGLMAVLGTTYTQVARLTVGAWCGAVGIGLLACALLMANNLRDIPTDRRSGKKTLAVRLGDRRARVVYQAELLAAFAAVVPVAVGSPRAWAVMILLPVVIHLMGPVGRGARGAELIQVLARTGQLELAYGIVLGIALALS
jgi:1,4-dihydroxy-2-naphthoate octaprenyltransferase